MSPGAMTTASRILEAARPWGIPLNGLFVFVAVFFIVLFIKYDVIRDGLLVSDDLIFYANASAGEPSGIPEQTPLMVLLYEVSVRYLPSVSAQMLAFLTIFATTATLLFSLFVRFFARPWTLVAGIVFAFTSFTAVPMVTFVSGSHSMVGFMFGAAGLLLSSNTIDETMSTWTRLGYAFMASVLFVAAILVTPFFYVFPAAASLWVLFSLADSRRWRPALWIPLATTAASITAILVYLFVGGNVYHTAGLEGWVDYSIVNVLMQTKAYAGTTVRAYVENTPDVWGLLVGTAIGGTLIGLAALFHTRRDSEEASSSYRIRVLVAVTILLAAGFLAIAAGLARTGMLVRYMFPSSALGILAVFLVVDFVVAHGRERVRWIVIVAVVALFGYNFATTLTAHDEAYGEVIRYQSVVARLIDRESDTWPVQSQIVIASEGVGRTLTDGYNHWSTGLLRILTGDQSLSGIIGEERWISTAGNPFVDAYRHHGPEYWQTIERNGEPFSKRRQMVGLVLGTPTFAYRFNVDDGTWQRIHWIA